MFLRPLSAAGHDLGRALVPFSVAVWDGAGKERGGNKALAGWRFLRMPGMAADPAYQAELAWATVRATSAIPGRGGSSSRACALPVTAWGRRRRFPGWLPT